MELAGVVVAAEVEDYAIAREKRGNTAVFVASEGIVVAIISIADEIRDDAKEALAAMRAQGVKKMIMLTGDNAHTARLVATELGLDEYHAELLPQDKVDYVKKLKAADHIVAMAGDGINDAPAIATAHIGIAMGEGGTDISMETAEKQTASFATEKVDTRIALFLVECLPDGNGKEIELPMSRKDLASYLGTTPETISRKLTEFEAAGLITQCGQGK